MSQSLKSRPVISLDLLITMLAVVYCLMTGNWDTNSFITNGYQTENKEMLYGIIFLSTKRFVNLFNYRSHYFALDLNLIVIQDVWLVSLLAHKSNVYLLCIRMHNMGVHRSIGHYHKMPVRTVNVANLEGGGGANIYVIYSSDKYLHIPFHNSYAYPFSTHKYVVSGIIIRATIYATDAFSYLSCGQFKTVTIFLYRNLNV